MDEDSNGNHQSSIRRFPKSKIRQQLGGEVDESAACCGADEAGLAHGRSAARGELVDRDLADGSWLRARRLSRATMTNIRQNLFFAFIYNSVGVPIAAGVLYPWFDILLSPIIAAAAMAFSSVSVIGNALRLNRVKM